MTPVLLDLIAEPLPSSSTALPLPSGAGPQGDAATALLWVAIAAAVLIAAAILTLRTILRHRRN